MDFDQGLDTPTCGQPTEPCKTLRIAVSRAQHKSTIHIQGNQYLDATIQIDKSLTIQGTNISSIAPLNRQESVYAFDFQLLKISINVCFVSIYFDRIGLLAVDQGLKRSISIVINNCYFNEGMRYDVDQDVDCMIESDAEKGSIGIEIKNTSFVSIEQCLFDVVTPTKVLSITDTTFRRVGRIKLTRVNNLLLTNATFNGVEDAEIKLVGKTPAFIIYKCKIENVPYFEIETSRNSPTNINISGTIVFDSAIDFLGSKDDQVHVSNCTFGNKKKFEFALSISNTHDGPVYMTDILCQGIRYGCLTVYNGRNFSIRRSAFRFNDGPSLYIASSTVSIENCSFVKNSASSGGAVSVDSSNVHIIRSIFSDNDAHLNGGALYAFGGATVKVTQSAFYGCSANSGGAITIKDGTLVVEGSILKENSAAVAAGGIYVIRKITNKVSITIRDTALVNNSAAQLDIRAANILLQNVTISATSISSHHHI